MSSMIAVNANSGSTGSAKSQKIALRLASATPTNGAQGTRNSNRSAPTNTTALQITATHPQVFSVLQSGVRDLRSGADQVAPAEGFDADRRGHEPEPDQPRG